MPIHFAALLALFDVGGPELMLIFVLILVLFGGKRLPELARGLGKSIREFKRATSGVEEQFKRALEEDPVPAKPKPKKLATKTAGAAASATIATTTGATEPTEPANAPGAPGEQQPTDDCGSDEIYGHDDGGDSSDNDSANDDDADTDSGDASEDLNDGTADPDHDEDPYMDPYEDEYIGGTAESDAAAHGRDTDTSNDQDHAGETGAENTPPSGAPKKSSQPGADSNTSDGGGI